MTDRHQRGRQNGMAVAIVPCVISVTTPSALRPPLALKLLFNSALRLGLCLGLGLRLGLWLGLGLGLALLLHTTSAHAAPLTHEQLAKAQQMAEAEPWQLNAFATNTPRTDNPKHPLAQQTLVIEPHVTKGQVSNDRVRVYQFNYHTASARVVTLSLFSDVIETTTPIPSVHLPLNAVEIQAAIDWLAKSSEALEQLRNDQIRRGLTPLATLSELSVKASIYAPIDKTDPCATERCALLSLFDNRNTVFALEPVINLQRGTQSWLTR